jgi:hypothetical protein
MKVYKAPLFFGKPLQDVVLLSDFEKAKERYFDMGLRNAFFEKNKGYIENWFDECFGVEK